MSFVERLGRAGGWLLAPITGAVAAARHARMFHPEGVVYRARVDALGPLGERLAGDAIVRFSTAWWRGGKEWIDALGCAMRLGRAPSDAPAPGDQDLLFATIQHPWTMLLAPLTTEQHDFLANDYFAVSPFDVDGAGRCKLRLVASRPRMAGADRGERLARAVEDGAAWLRLQLKPAGAAWADVARVTLLERDEQVDQARLRFSPFRAGKGIRPRGFVHMLRKGAYALSQAARPA